MLTGHVYRNQGDTDKAIAAYQKSMHYAEQEAHLKSLVLSNHMNIGNIYLESKKYETALTEFEKANALSENDNERGDTLERIAMAHFALGHTGLAVEKQLQTQMMQKKSGSLDQFANASIDLGRYYLADERINDAERTLNKIIKFSKDNGGAYYEAKGSYLLAKVKMAQKDEETARTLVAHAKRIAKDTHDAQLKNEIQRETGNLFK